MDLPFISVVIPNLHSPVIGLTLDSVHRQTYDRTHYEVIVVGQDRLELVREDGLVRFLRSDVPLPPSVARNRGAAAARGEILAFLDADCEVFPDWLTAIASWHNEPGVQVVGGAVDFAYDRYWTLADNISTFHEFWLDAPGDRRSLLPSLNLSIRRSLFLEVGGFDERYPRPSGEDSDLSLRLRRRGCTLHFKRGAAVFHRPPRTRLSDLLRHAYFLGKYSIKVDPRYADTPDSLPAWLRWRPSLILTAPVLAAGIVARIYLPHRTRWRFWYTAPAVFWAKITWCVGAATHPNWKEEGSI